MKKIIVAIVSVLVVFAAQVFAQATTNEVTFNYEFRSHFYSRYVSPFGRLVYDNPVIQSEATIWAKPKFVSGAFYVDIWHSSSFNGNMNADSGDELDYSLGWKGETFKQVNLNIWARYLDYVPMGRDTKRNDQIWFSTELDRKFQIFEDHSVSPFWRMEIPFSVHNFADCYGVRSYLGLRHVWNFFGDCSVSQRASFVFDDGAMGLKPGVLGDYKVGLSWQVKKWLAIEPFGFRIIGPLQSTGDGRKTQKVFTSGLFLKF